MKRFASILVLIGLSVFPLNPIQATADIAEPANRFDCSIQNTTEEPLKDGSCDRYLLGINNYEFKTCTYSSYGLEIARSSNGLFRLHVRSANSSGFQTSRTLEIDVHLQENCTLNFDSSSFIVGGLVSGAKGAQIRLSNPTVTFNWRPSNISRLPGYCGFRSCSDSKHSFKVELPDETDFYTITLFFADAKSGLTNGLKNSSAIFPNIILRAPSNYSPNSVPFSLNWRKSENGYQCEISTPLSRQELWNAGVREIRLFSTAGPSEAIQTKGPNLGLTFANDPANSGRSPTGKISHAFGLFKYDLLGPSVVANEYFEMSALLVYSCKAWLTTISGASGVVSSSISPTESFANPIPVVPVEREIKDNWVDVSWISAFKGTSKSLITKQKSEIKKFMDGLPESGIISCSGYYSHPNTTARSNLARSRAKAVCDHAKRLYPEHTFSFKNTYTGNKKLNGQVFISAKQK